MKKLAFILFAAFAIAGCSSADEPTGESPAAETTDNVGVQGIDHCIEHAGTCVAQADCAAGDVISSNPRWCRTGSVCCSKP